MVMVEDSHLNLRRKSEDGVKMRRVTQVVICIAAVLLITLAMINGETWKDKIVISLAVLIFTGFSLVWNSFVINLMEKVNKKGINK